jgi:hypothetical protein
MRPEVDDGLITSGTEAQLGGWLVVGPEGLTH